MSSYHQPPGIFISGLTQTFLVLISVAFVGCSDVAMDTAEEKKAVAQKVRSCNDGVESEVIVNPFVTATNNPTSTPLAPTIPLLSNPFGRKLDSLNGEWKFLVDQLDMGDKGSMMRGGIGGNRTAQPMELIEYEFSESDTLTVPGDWNSEDEELKWYRGVVWYSRTFDFEPYQETRAILYFGGAYFRKDIYLNGQYLASHKGGFTPFNLDITEFVQSGQNVITVKVDSRSDSESIPTEYNDWKNYGGLTRDVLLLQVPSSYIQSYKVQLDRERRDLITGWIQLGGDVSSTDATLEIEELGISKSFTTDESGYVYFSFEANPELWEPGNPKRYLVKLNAGDDVINERIGFRSIDVRGTEIFLNNKPVFLRGISMHEESLLKQGRASTKEDAEVAISVLQDLNANFVRLAHYLHNEHMVEAAERAGILIWSEIPVYHSISYGNPCTLEDAKRQYSEMIARDQNRAAVILWSLSNETPVTDARNNFLRELAIHVRNLDDSRLLASALYVDHKDMEKIGENVATKVLKSNDRNGMMVKLAPTPDPVTITLDDPLGNIVDVVGYNEYLGWYVSGHVVEALLKDGWDATEAEIRAGMLEEIPTVTIESIFGKPLIISEFGAGAKHGFRSQEAAVWSEEYQLKVYQQQLSMLSKTPGLAGMSPWVLKDFRSPYRLNNRFQNYWNRKGLLSETGKRKLAFFALRDHYAKISDNAETTQAAD